MQASPGIYKKLLKKLPPLKGRKYLLKETFEEMLSQK